MLIDTSRLPMNRIGPDDQLIPKQTALIIVDMINLFCDVPWLAQHEGDPARATWFTEELARAIPNIRRALAAFRAVGGLVVHVVNAKWTREGREVVPYQRGRDYDLFDTPKMSVIPPLAPISGEIMVRKVASSAFTGTGLEFMLHNAGIRNVVLCGQYGDGCVFYTLIQSREHGFSNFWMEDALLHASDVHRDLVTALVGSRLAKLASTASIIHALGGSPDMAATPPPELSQR
jgi:nicotinamidase-related amidase